MSTDIVQRLRIGIEAGAIDLADIMDAADEIERLRLTEEEREAVESGIAACEDITSGASSDEQAAATLRGLLEKHKPHAQPEQAK